MDASVKGKQQKQVRQVQCQEQCMWPFGIIACQFFRTTFLEIAVYYLYYSILICLPL